MVNIFKKIIIISSFFSFNGFFAGQNARKPQIQIKTIPSANARLSSVISSIPANNEALLAYEKAESAVILQSAKILYDNARQQILDALLEIDNRIAYWQDQKDHPWNYFVSKNPLKWVTGIAQEDEVEDNLETLKSHQGELYVLLGQLSELGSAFITGYKDTFMKDHQQGYAWVDTLLDALVRIKTPQQATNNMAFIARVCLLQAKLEKVNQFKDELLSDISETAKPSYFARNWLKGGMALLAMGYGYNNISYQQVADSVNYATSTFNTITQPVQETIKDVITPGWNKKIKTNGMMPEVPESYATKLELVKRYVTDMGNKYKLQNEAKNVLKAFDNNDYSAYGKFVEDVGAKEEFSYSGIKQWAQSLEDYGRGHLLGDELEVIRHLRGLGEWASAQEKQFAGVGKLILLIPAIAMTTGAYWSYQKLIEKNYAPLRYALVDINSLFVDPTKQLTDEQYGKMIYLVHVLKKRAEKELPIKNNMRANFIQDLEKIESSEFNVAAKRAIVDDMFKKYEFLGLIQKK
jgi:hypothetical protein